MGATESGRWQASHFDWKIGATSRVKVGADGADCPARAGVAHNTDNPNVTARSGVHWRIGSSSESGNRTGGGV